MKNFFLIIFALTFEIMAQGQTNENFTLVMHGGAGTILKKNMTADAEKAYIESLKSALQRGYEILKNGGTSIDAVESVIIMLEDNPLFNAGKGAVFTNEEKNELDASIMDGETLKAGAVAGVREIKNPIKAARMVMEKTPHVLLIGSGADKFAKEKGLEIVDSSYFYNEKRFRQLQKIKDTEKQQLDHSDDRGQALPDPANPEYDEMKEEKFGTVGAVALDKYGNIAAGTSTGGMTNKMYGRIGDSPIIGAGTYADNKTCAVSCTGHGEYFIRGVVAHDVAALMEYKGMSVEEAAGEVINNKLKAIGGDGGLIAIDAKGNFAMPFNTEGMYRGYVREDGKTFVFIYK